MLSHIRSLSTRPARSWASASGCRCLSVSVPRNDEPVARAPRRSRSRSVRLTADNAEAQYDEFLNSEGRRFKSANKPNNWLGDTVVEFIPFFPRKRICSLTRHSHFRWTQHSDHLPPFLISCVRLYTMRICQIPLYTPYGSYLSFTISVFDASMQFWDWKAWRRIGKRFVVIYMWHYNQR